MAEKRYLITPNGARSLREELSQLLRVERPEMTQKVSDAAALGDRSENADYIYGKKRLREIDRRIRFLSKRLENIEVVDRKPTDRERVFFGAWLRLEDEAGEESVLRIVGADEFDLKRGWISIDSPMAKGLLGKSKGDDALVNRPAGAIEVHILDVSYDEFQDSIT